MLLVGSDRALRDELLHVVHDVTADVPHGDATLLGEVPDDFDELFAPLFGQLWDRQPITLPSFDGVSLRSDSWIASRSTSSRSGRTAGSSAGATPER